MMDIFYHIIVGGGSAGSVLAVRLAETTDRSVLLLEAGADFDSRDKMPPQLLRMSSMAAVAPGNAYNWGFFGKTDYATVPIVRGRVMGGGSTVNGAGFWRPQRADLDGWSKAGNPEWSYEKLLPTMRAIENDHDHGGNDHGNSGPIPVTRPRHDDLLPISKAFVAACHELGFPDDPDKNASTSTVGIGRNPMNSVKGDRIGTLLAFMNRARNRPNLTIRSGVFVRRVLFEGNRAVGVEIEADGGVQEIRGKEVILSAGAIKSPHMLMLSGIGPADQLRAHGISVVRDLPGVGQNFQDHPGVDISYLPRKRFSLGRDSALAEVALHYTATGSDIPGDMEMLMMTVPMMQVLSEDTEFKLRDVLKLPRQLFDKLRAGLQLGIGGLLRMRRAMTSQALSCRLMAEYGRGTSRLISADPHVLPEFNFKSFSDPRDVARLRECVRLGVRVLETDAMRPLVKRRLVPTDADLADDDTLTTWIRNAAPPYAHTIGTCRMGPASDPDAVVDQQCRVHGVEGLRVVDLSICPVNPRRGPAAIAMVIGAHVAEIIAGSLNSTASSQNTAPPL